MILVAVMMPFGMLAIVGLPKLGGLSLLAVNVASAAAVGAGILLLLGRLMRGDRIRLEPSAIAILIFAAYTIFSATVLVRLFSGEIMVFSLSRSAGGVRVSTAFLWGKVWLSPGSSNISQTFYIVLASGLFIVAVNQLSRRGAAFGDQCMAWAAGVNLGLGVLDMAALDPVLALIRTASYSLMNEATVAGIPRVIGGFSESASFGAFSAVLFAYFATLALRTGRRRDAVLALGNGVFACLALSATGLLAVAVVTCILLVQVQVRVPEQTSRGMLLGFAVVLAAGGLGLAAALTMTDAPAMVASVINDLIINKSQSSSGLERSAWMMGGLEALQQSMGPGVGAGSLRSNGLLFVLLGSVGIPGTAAFCAFLILAFGGRAIAGQEDTLAATRLGAVAALVSLMLSATVPDPGVPLIFLAALAVATRRNPATVDAAPMPRMPHLQTRSLVQ